jgi:hypothetical protein
MWNQFKRILIKQNLLIYILSCQNVIEFFKTIELSKSVEHFQNLISLMLQSACNIPIALKNPALLCGMFTDTLCDRVRSTLKETNQEVKVGKLY